MSYLLRRVIFEDRWKNQLEELIDFHKDSSVTEVLFMEQSHQMLMVPWPLDKHRRMASVYAEMAIELRKHNISVGINIASIVGHSDSDVPEHLKLPFQKIVDDELIEAKACYCILDPKWQDYASEVCSLYANKVKPNRLFIDDDFRPINHRRFMGCFCSLHAESVSKKYGLKLNSAKLLEHIKGDSLENLSIRRLWQKVHANTEIIVMSRIRDEIAVISPQTQFGLMANGESNHSVSGRKINLLLDAMTSPGKRPLCRPASAIYRDTHLLQGAPFHIAHSLGESCSVMRVETEVISEVEGWPHTRFMKSLKALQSELLIQAICGAEKFSLNIFDYIASPMRLEKGYAKLLCEIRPCLEKIVKARKGKVPCGLAVPWKSDFSAHLTYPKSGGLYPDRSAHALMSQIGIPIQYNIGNCNLLCGQEVLAYSDSELHSILSNGLMMDSTAAVELQNRGFGKLLGCRIETLPHNAAILERLDDTDFAGPFAGTFCDTKWMALPPYFSIHKLLPEDAKAISTFVDFDLMPVAPGTVYFENSLGGRVVIFGAPVNPLTWQFANRAYWARQLVRWASRDSIPVMLDDAVNVGPLYFENPETGEGLLAIVNSGLDEQPVNISTSLDLTPFDLPFFENTREFIEALGMRFYLTKNKLKQKGHKDAE